MSNCSGSCGSCDSKSSCGIAKLLPCEGSRVKRVIGIMSGKGGVGKSLTCAAMAILMARKGYSVGVIDGDITGASQAKIFNQQENLSGDGKHIFPAITMSGIKLVSINLMIESPETPVVWRGSMVSNCLKQFFSDVVWEDIDYIFVDMPPGTGDVPLTVFQSYPLDGLVMVTTPQALVSMILAKGVKMAQMMNVPIVGVVENMSYCRCECGKVIYPFGESKLDEVASRLNIKVLGKQAINSILSEACDLGKLEEIDLSDYNNSVEEIISKYPV